MIVAGQISAEAGIVFNGNTHGDVQTLIQTSHLFKPLPETIRDDDAFHDRWHAYLPGWEMPKLTPNLFTKHLGFIADYIAEIFHNKLRPLNFTDAYEKHFAFGKQLGHRDRKAVMRTVSGLIKLIHPGGDVSKDELAEYLTFGLEMRLRVKEQLKRINPSEFANSNLTYIDKATGSEFSARCPEIPDVDTQSDPEPLSAKMKGSPAADESVIETFHAYDLLHRFDSGGMAEAYRARKRDSGEIVFLKRVRRKSADNNALEREMQIYERLMRLNTPHVLKVLDFVRNDEYVALITQFADGGDLGQYVETHGDGHGVSVGEAKKIALSLVAALEELHRNNFVHRDLKPQNVLLLNGEWKIADFGISKNRDRIITQKTFQQHGTLGYAAPEQFAGVEARPSADVYSLGKILVFLITGQTDVDYVTFPGWRELILRCICHNPEERITLDKLTAGLNSLVA